MHTIVKWNPVFQIWEIYVTEGHSTLHIPDTPNYHSDVFAYMLFILCGLPWDELNMFDCVRYHFDVMP